MIAVVISFPGHFLLTRLTIDSLRRFYPDYKQIRVMYDNAVVDGWSSYVDDAAEFYQLNKSDFIAFDDVDNKISTCKMGWYRQQLVKCCIDKHFSGDQWFVVDGDIIFDEKIEVAGTTPVAVRPLAEAKDVLSLSVLTCIKNFLNVDHHPLQDDQRYVVTSCVPFRVLTRETLRELRKRAEHFLGGDFVEQIINQCHSQQLVAYDNDGVIPVMHEWELIESVNRILYPGKFPLKEVGAGYQHYQHTSAVRGGNCYRQGYVYDYELHRDWFDAQLDTAVSDYHWDCVQSFGDYIRYIQGQPL